MHSFSRKSQNTLSALTCTFVTIGLARFIVRTIVI